MGLQGYWTERGDYYSFNEHCHIHLSNHNSILFRDKILINNINISTIVGAIIIITSTIIITRINLMLCPLEKSPGHKLNSPFILPQPILTTILGRVIHRHFLNNIVHVIKPAMLHKRNRVSSWDQ